MEVKTHWIFSADLMTPATMSGGEEYLDAVSLVICCKMARPWGAGPGAPRAVGTLSPVRGGTEPGARLLGTLPE